MHTMSTWFWHKNRVCHSSCGFDGQLVHLTRHLARLLDPSYLLIANALKIGGSYHLPHATREWLDPFQVTGSHWGVMQSGFAIVWAMQVIIPLNVPLLLCLISVLPSALDLTVHALGLDVVLRIPFILTLVVPPPG
jgi:hypothetical protein